MDAVQMLREMADQLEEERKVAREILAACEAFSEAMRRVPSEGFEGAAELWCAWDMTKKAIERARG